MSAENKDLEVRTELDQQPGSSRRKFLHRAGVAGVVGAVGFGGLLTLSAPSALSALGRVQQDDRRDDRNEDRDDHRDEREDKKRDRDILIAAEIAEALAVTTYSNIIDTSAFFTRLPADDQGYLVAARQEEMSHYLLEKSVTASPSPYTTFFYPKNMFDDAQTTLNTLVTLEDAFIAAYLVGVRNFSTRDLRVTSARIMGIESDHRTLARVLAGDIAAQDGGPIETITGAQGVAEDSDPPNNNGYERTLCWTHIDQAVAALTPFVDMAAAQAAGFDTSKSFTFDPFNPTLPNPLGDFISFSGC